MNINPPQEWIAIVESIHVAGDTSFVTFTTGTSPLQLVGDTSKLQPLHDQIGKTVRLHVKDFDNWTWEPFENPNEKETR